MNERAFGDGYDEVGASATMPALSPAMGPVTTSPERMLLEAKQRDDLVRRFQEYLASGAAVAAVRTAPRDVRLAPERDDAGATVASLHMDLCFVDEAWHQ